MSFSNQLKIEEIRKKFDLAIASQEQCKIYVEAASGEYWNFYFQSGGLIWATSSIHRLRRLYRVIQKHCPEVNCQEIKLREKEISELWGYLVLVVLYKRGQISLEAFSNIIHEIATEVLFDLFQLSSQINSVEHVTESSQHPMRAILKSVLLKKPIAQLDAKSIYISSEQMWNSWLKADFAGYSPNLSLTIEDSDRLENATNSNTFLKLSLLVDGRKTIRDLAVVTKQEALTLLRSFYAYIEPGYLKLKQVQDEYLIFSHTPTTALKPVESLAESKPPVGKSFFKREVVKESQPLIVCIDDSPKVCEQMCKIVNGTGYSFVSIQESIQALTVLLEQKPDLIFLDLVMPITNGYELCSQIRRVSLFKDTPVVILTGNDGVIDRVRAKMVGASEFVSKPIERAKILSIVRKYCSSDSLVGKARSL